MLCSGFRTSALFSSLFLTLIACGSSDTGISTEGATVYCGAQELDQDQWINGQLVNDLQRQAACWAVWDEGDFRMRQVLPGFSGDPDGLCEVEAASIAGPFEGSCHWWVGGNQIQVQLIPGESTVSLSESLNVDLQVNTTVWDGNILLYGRGSLLLPDGAQGAEGPSPFTSVDDLPQCNWESCYEGEFVLVEALGPPKCQEAVNAQAGTMHRVDIVSDNEVDLGNRLLRSAADFGVCNKYYSQDGNKFNVFQYTLTESEISVQQTVEFAADTGELVECVLNWVIETTSCSAS